MEKKSTKSLYLRKVIVATLVLAVLLCLSGCVRFKATAKITKDGKADITILYATMSSSEAFSFDDTPSPDTDDMEEFRSQMKHLEELDWNVSPYNKDDYKGFTATKEGIDIEDLADELDDTDLGFDGFTIEKEGKLYVIDWDPEKVNDKISANGLDNQTLSSYGGYMTFSLELPYAAEDDNATDSKSEGKKLTWELNNLDEDTIHCEFKLGKEKGAAGGGFPMWGIGLIIGGVVIIVGLVVMIIILSMRSKQTRAVANAAYAATVAQPTNAAPAAQPQPQASYAPKPSFAPQQQAQTPTPPSPTSTLGFPPLTPPSSSNGNDPNNQ